MWFKKERLFDKFVQAFALFFILSQVGCAAVRAQSSKMTRTHHQEEVTKKDKMTLLDILYKEGDAALKRGDYDKAIESFTEILSMVPNYRDTRKKLVSAQNTREKRQGEKAKEEKEKKAEAARLSLLYEEGNAAFKKGEYHKATGLFIKILISDPTYRDVQKKLMMAHGAEEAQPTAVRQEAQEGGEEESALKEYTINLGDVLDISVWQWEDLKVTDVYVRPDGKISFPLVGDVQAVGKTVTEIDQDITQKLTEYIKSPEVSVAIRRFGGKKVIVLGQVSGPGVYAPTGRSSLLEVIALAGGFLNTAVTSNVVVIRGNTVKSEAIVCDLRRALKEGDLSQNISAEANDIIYVPRRFITSLSDLASEIGGPISTTLAGTAVAKEFNWHRAGGR